MDGGARPPHRSFRISPVDRLGRRISPSVLDAAEEVGRRAIEHAERELIDPAVAATLLEDAVQVRSAGSHNSTDPAAELELKILVDELLTRCEPVTRDMFYRRTQGFSWKEIGLSYGISGHAAESRFNQALHKVGVKLGLRSKL